jgi:hypothetical protein
MKQKLFLLLALPFCWASTWALDQVNGVYQIGSAQNLVDFATLVNGGTTGANAVLTTNIDLDDTTWTPIGNSTNKYAGTFDGQGYAITNFEYTATSDYNGLFGYISNATVKNFSISGTLTSDGFTKNGVVGCATGTAKVTGIHSSMTVILANKNAHSGGIVGGDNGATTDKIVVDGCEFSGTLTHSGTGDCQAGIMGYTGYSTIRNCIFSGTINGGNSKYGGILGYCKQPSFGGVQNCLSIGKIVADPSCTTAAAIIANFNGAATSNVKNNYYCLAEGSTTTIAIGNKASSCEAPHAVTAEQLASGEVCYLLNGSQGGNSWRQNLASGTLDAIPTLDSTHERVYQFGSSYINDGTDVTIDDETDLQDFATIVNAGALSLNAILTDDIDMSTLTSWTAIGDWGSTPNGSACFKGHFNGQGHAINNFDFTATHNYFSIFGVISTGALIENFSVNGSINNSSNRYVAGAVAYARDDNPTIRNIRSYVNISSTKADGRHGGILGGSLDGTVKIDNCSYFGELKVPTSGNFGGIVGYVNNSTNAFLDITDCLFAGEIEYTDGVTSGNSACGGIVGYNNAGYATIKNCLSLGDITTEVRGLIFGLLNGNNSKVYNCYYQGDYANYSTSTGTASPMEATAVSDEQLASGEICYLLNESVSGGTDWYQTLPGDSKPTLDNTHELVYVNGTVCPDTGAPQGTVSYGNSEGTIVGNHHFVDGFCSYCDFLDESYMTPIDGNYMIGTPAQLMWFAAFVNAGHQAANAKLANITPLDLTGVAVEPIGNSSAAYTGTFDGQGKSIMGFSATSTGNGGLFGNINNATIKDFSIDGVLDVIGGTASGVIGYSKGSIISGIHSSLTVTTNAGTAVGHVGGVVGSLNQNDNVSGCSFSGSITVNANSHNCFGGIVGYMTSNDKIQNCANYGSIIYSKNNCYAGGIEGYINATSASIQNCLSTGAVTYVGEGTATYGGAIVGYMKSTYVSSNFSDNYWLGGSAAKAYGSKTDEANEADATQLASGEVAYKLGSAWYQTIETDTYPTLSNASEKVLYVGAAGYSTMYDAANGWELVGDAKAYIGTINGSALHLDEIADIPSGTAVVISGTYYNKVSTSATATTTGNKLLGSDGTVSGGDGIYALAIKNDKVGFYPVAASVTIPAGKAYLEYTGTGGGAVKGFTFVFDDDDPTGIEDLKDSKDLKDSNVIYNIAGQRINKMQRGINIVNGKKVLK